MKFRSGDKLGIALFDRSISFAEVSGGASPRVVRTATFLIDSAISFDKPAELGAVIGTFLKQQGVKSRHAVIGLPARWLITREQPVPPGASANDAASMIRMAAERQASGPAGQIVFDYAGALGGDETRVLLVGMLQDRLTALKAFAEAAGLSVDAVTGTALAVASQLPAGNDAPVVVLDSRGTEVVWRHGSSARALKHIGAATTAGGEIGDAQLAVMRSELKRAFALTPTNGTGRPRDLVVIDAMGISPPQLAYLSTESGLTFSRGITPPTAGPSANDMLPAVMLALAGLADAVPVDFTNSKLAVVAARRITRPIQWAIIGASALVLLIVALFWLTSSRQSELARLDAELDKEKQPIKDAERIVNRVTRAQQYYELRPPTLEPMREITLALRDNDPLWLTGFSMKDTHQGGIQGKSTDKNVVLGLLDRLNKSKKFRNVKLIDMREAAAKSKDVMFSIGFEFVE